MVARLDGYARHFNKRSTGDQSGKANIVPDGEQKKVSATVLTVKYAEAPLHTQRHAYHD